MGLSPSAISAVCVSVGVGVSGCLPPLLPLPVLTPPLPGLGSLHPLPFLTPLLFLPGPLPPCSPSSCPPSSPTPVWRVRGAQVTQLQTQFVSEVFKLGDEAFQCYVYQWCPDAMQGPRVFWSAQQVAGELKWGGESLGSQDLGPSLGSPNILRTQ